MSERPRTVAVSASVVHAKLGDEAVLLNVESGVYFGLDEVGTRIWELLASGCTEDEIVARMLDEYDVDPAVLREDVAGFLRELAATGLTNERDGRSS